MKPNRSKDLRERNKELVIQKLLSQNDISRQEVIRNTGLAPSTVSNLISELMSNGMIRKIGALGASGSGRKTDVLTRVPDYASIISISLTFENNHISLVDLGLNILDSLELNFDSSDDDSVSTELILGIDAILKRFKDSNIIAVSLALPHHPYNWSKIRKALETAISLPLLMINNVEAMAVYDQYSLVENQERDSLFYIFVGTGIGSAFIINGNLYRGVNGFASDLGHIHMTDQDLPCRCGRKGCLETVASEDSLRKALTLLSNHPVDSPAEMIDILKSGLERHESDMIDALKSAAGYLAEAMHTVIALLDPSHIIVSSRLNRLSPFYSAMIEESLYTRFGNRSPFSITRNYIDFNRDSGVKGAALFACLVLYCGKK